ncbi:hypothetical protein U1839_09830 [Sphingomonas sp. RT2P30]|uniref:hypothetical protein n=1 Tax=Parasphingomonas halimpatiens TaxID=3096162 RepID=UPI002FC60915
MREEDLARLNALDEAATPGPWFVRRLDDNACMCAVAVSTKADGDDAFVDEWRGEEMVAACLIQDPPYVVPEARWDENAALIAAMRNALPELLRLARLGLVDAGRQQP